MNHYKNYSIYLLFLPCLLALSCGPLPSTKYDRFDTQATLQKDEPVHNKNSVEWWYMTGHLKDTVTGKGYGIEYVFFHANPFSKKDYLMANMAITDTASERFIFNDRFHKVDSTLPSTLPINLKTTQKNTEPWYFFGERGIYDIKAYDEEKSFGLSLRTRPEKEAVFYRNTGYEEYEIGKAGYYSYTRLETEGTLYLPDDTVGVAGTCWYDRQWNIGNLMQQKPGWDWMAIQLDTLKMDIMLYRGFLLKKNVVVLGGAVIDSNSIAHHLDRKKITIEEYDFWQSKKSKKYYPTRYKISLPDYDMELIIEAAMDNQELYLKPRPLAKLVYWEGMCVVSGTMKGNPITGKAYVEMTERDKKIER